MVSYLVASKLASVVSAFVVSVILVEDALTEPSVSVEAVKLVVATVGLPPAYKSSPVCTVVSYAWSLTCEEDAASFVVSFLVMASDEVSLTFELAEAFSVVYCTAGVVSVAVAES